MTVQITLVTTWSSEVGRAYHGHVMTVNSEMQRIMGWIPV